MQTEINPSDSMELNLDIIYPMGKISAKAIKNLSDEEIGFFKIVSGNNVSALRCYLKKGVNVNVLPEDRTSPLHQAARYADIQIIEELIINGADVNITDIAGWTPLHVACYHR